MLKVDAKDYINLLNICYEEKTALMVYGGYGIGKSMIPRQVFEATAKNKNKKFILWEETTKDEKIEIIHNAKKYFVFCDQRICQMDSTELRGVPNMLNTEMLQTIPYSWAVYFTQKDADGIIFFDELNLAVPTVMSSAYQIINDRTISDRRISDDVFVLAAGNRREDCGNIFEMPDPLHDRFCEIELEVNMEDWVAWAYRNVNAHLISFIQWKPSRLYDVSFNKKEKASTPRGIARASKLVKQRDILGPLTYKLIAMSCGEPFACEFQSYIANYKELNWESIFKNPKSIKDFTTDKLWAVVGGLAEKFTEECNIEDFHNIIKVINNVPSDFAVVSLKMLKGKNQELFDKYTDEKSPCFEDFKKAVKDNLKYLYFIEKESGEDAE